MIKAITPKQLTANHQARTVIINRNRTTGHRLFLQAILVFQHRALSSRVLPSRTSDQGGRPLHRILLSWDLRRGVVSKGVVSKSMSLQVVSVLQQCCLPCCLEQHIVFWNHPLRNSPLGKSRLKSSNARARAYMVHSPLSRAHVLMTRYRCNISCTHTRIMWHADCWEIPRR